MPSSIAAAARKTMKAVTLAANRRARFPLSGYKATASAVPRHAFRGDVSAKVRWDALAATFFLLSVFWVAIWPLDFMYYNRLLLGASAKKGRTKRAATAA